LKRPYSRFRRLLYNRARRDYGRRHCELVILVPGRPNGPPHLDEVSVEVLYTQRLARRTQHALRVYQWTGQPRASAAKARALRYITQSATFCAR